jgi:hypothetical protein
MSDEEIIKETVEIVKEAVDRCDPKTDGERVTLFNIILAAIRKAKNPQGKNMRRCETCGTWIY